MRYPDSEMIGRKFAKLTVVERKGSDKSGKKTYLCKCDCGNLHVATGTALRTGKVKSCGCAIYEKKYSNYDAENPSDVRLYRTWHDMKRRCEDPRRDDYSRYGGKGITVCDEWHNFQAFLDWSKSNGYKNGLTIDRIDGSRGYSPDNCRWADIVTQNNNRSNNHLITFDNETMTMSQWSRKIGLSYWALRSRLHDGWSVREALTTPLNGKRGDIGA